MKRIVWLVVLVCAILLTRAQDQLFKKDNTRILVKVVEVGPDDVRYKLFENLNGPTYIESKANISLIIFQNGEHQVFTTEAVVPKTENDVKVSKENMVAPPMSAVDSVTYFRHSNSISVNFLNFFNNELGILYRREFFRGHFNIIIPVAFGVSRPNVTQSVYFNRNGPRLELDNKMVEGGFGIHYYPSLRTNSNYYIGPMVRFMQYACTQYDNYNMWGLPPVSTSKSTTLTRWAFSITNGLIYRTRSRLTTSMFASLGFKRDIVADPLVDLGGQPVEIIPNPVSFYWWSGFEVGFNF